VMLAGWSLYVALQEWRLRRIRAVSTNYR